MSTVAPQSEQRNPGVTCDSTRMVSRRYWARRMVDRAKGAELPSYGSAEWFLLPEGDARRVAAVVVAAEAWARAGDDLILDLTRELDARCRAHKLEADREYAGRAAAHRETAPRWGQSFAERRAAQLEAAKPQPGDFRGRNQTVRWDGGAS